MIKSFSSRCSIAHRGAVFLCVLGFVIAVALCSLAPNKAFADPISTSGDLLNSVSGNVYLTNPPSANSGQFWSNGAWHNFSEITPADKRQNGPARDLGGGWYIQWMGKTNGGEYMIWRYHNAWTYNGATWGGFKVRFNNIGYTSKGEAIDSILDFTSVMAWKFDGTPSPTWFSPFEITTKYGPIVGAVTTQDDAADTTPVGVQSIYGTSIVKHGTDTLIDSDNEVDIVYWDIDRPVVMPDKSLNYSSNWRESVHFVSGYKGATVGTHTTLQVSDNGTWFRSTQNDDSQVPDNLSTVVAKATPQFTTEWRGHTCSTGIGYDTRVTVYPEWSAPVKSPERQIHKRGETASFDVTETFPYVADSNKASSIVMEDTLDNALDASRATVQVLKNGVDVTDNWTISISGQTIKATAKNTGHGYAEDKHVFRITAPVSESANLDSYETENIDGNKYWKVPNTASVAVNNNAKVTNTVHVFVPYEAKGSVQLKATKSLLGGALQANQFTFTLKDSNGALIDTKKNDTSGAVTFGEIPYTQEDIGKTYTYTIEETPGADAGMIYDSHSETVTVKIEDAGSGKLAITTTYDDDGAASTNTKTIPVTVLKTSTDGSVLSGAEFTLYKDDGNNTFDANDTPATVYSDAGLTTAIPGAVVTTDAAGEGHYYGLMPGTNYWIKETKAPSGYNLDTKAHLIAVAADGTVSTKDSAGVSANLPLKNGVASITIADEPIPNLPLTAGSGMVAALLFFGGLLAIGGSALILRHQFLDSKPNEK